jgi:hypothetical protein
MDPKRAAQVVTPLVIMFLEEVARGGGARRLLDLQDTLLYRYGADMIRLLAWNDARVLDQKYFGTGGVYLRAHHGWPHVGDEVFVNGVCMVVTVTGLFTFNARAVRMGSHAEESSEEEEDEGDRL